MITRFALRNRVFRVLPKYYSEGSTRSPSQSATTPTPPSSSEKVNPEVPGLSSAVVELASQPVGPDVAPDKSGAYKVPEYFCYNNTSYFEAEIEMLKYRLPQPSALKK